MTTSVLDGPGGLNHTHRWNSDTFVLNDLTASPPRAILNSDDGITGLFDAPDSDDQKENSTAQIGETLWPTLERGKTVVYKGVIEAPTEPQLAALRQSMRRAFRAGMSTPRLVEIRPHPTYGTVIWGYFARVLSGGLQIDEGIIRGKNHPHGAYARKFQLSIRMPDPRFLLLSDYKTYADQLDGVAHVVNNPGDAFADPIFTITVPAGTSTIDITNTSISTPSGTARLRFTGVPAGTLVVDFTIGSRSARLGAADAMRYFDSDYSNWWDEFIPGIGGIDDTASGNNTVMVDGGDWQVEYFPRCW